MAIDTANKRCSAIDAFCPWRMMMPAPDGTIDEFDRQHGLDQYAGIAASIPAVGGGSFPVIGNAGGIIRGM